MEFTTVQLGLDVATSLAVTGSAAAFFINQAHKYKQTKRLQLDTSVRTVAAEQVQNALHDLSQIFIYKVAKPLTHTRALLGGHMNDLKVIQARLEINKDLPSTILEEYENIHKSLRLFFDNIENYKYQLYPLLDTLRDGQKEISAFKKELDELRVLLQKSNNSGLALTKEFEGVLAFCVKYPSFKNLSDEQLKELYTLTGSIMLDSDYTHWVNTFIPSGKESLYWETEETEERTAVRRHAATNFIAHAYEEPNRLRAQVFRELYFPYQEVTVQCREFIVMLAAINHTLLLGEDSKENLSDTFKRYKGKDFFALDEDIY